MGEGVGGWVGMRIASVKIHHTIMYHIRNEDGAFELKENILKGIVMFSFRKPKSGRSVRRR